MALRIPSHPMKRFHPPQRWQRQFLVVQYRPMTTTPVLAAPARFTALATFGASHGYRFDADTVALTASFHLHAPAAHQRTWTLQLWACTNAPATRDEIQGQLVASASLPPIGEIADPVDTFTVTTQALLPAGQTDYSLALALIAATADGRSEIHDLAVYPRRETFSVPRLIDGRITELAEGRAVIAAHSVENPRDASNTSGTLALELWAMDQAYNGGDFTGFPITGVVLGTLAGQCSWTGLHFPLTAALPEKNSRLVLMLREWNGNRYITRDYVNLSEPFIAPVSKPAIGVTPVNEAPKSTAKTKKSSRTATVSINKAAEAEFATVKGLSQPLAQAIIAGRPYARIDDLVKVKGVGPKLLAKIRSRLRLN